MSTTGRIAPWIACSTPQFAANLSQWLSMETRSRGVSVGNLFRSVQMRERRSGFRDGDCLRTTWAGSRGSSK
jgi:hypothetical protein